MHKPHRKSRVPAGALRSAVWESTTTLYVILIIILLGLAFNGYFVPSRVRWTILVLLAIAPLAVPGALQRGIWRSGGGLALLLLLGGNLTALVHAASIPMTVHGILLWFAVTILFCAGFWLAKSPAKVEPVFVDGLAVVVAATVAAGVLGWLKVIPLTIGGAGQTFAPFLDYRNAYAMFCAVGALAATVVDAEGRWARWRWPVFLLCTWGLGLTGSRGGLLVFLIVLGGYALFGWRKLYRVLPQFAILAVAGLVAGEAIRSHVQARAAAPGSATLVTLAALLAGMALTWVYQRVSDRPGFRPWWVYAAGGVLAVPGLIYLYPRAAVFTRLLFTDESNIGRFHHLQDSWAVFLQYPLGLGWDGWRSVYTAYQDYGYVINFIHSGIMELLVATGVLGLASIIVLLATLGVRYLRLWRQNRWSPYGHAWFWALGALLLHASFDMDLMETMFVYILWFSAGYLAGYEFEAPATRTTSSDARSITGAVALLVAAGLVAIIYSDLTFDHGVNQAKQENLAAAEAQFRKAIKFNPLSAAAKINLANVISFREYQGDRRGPDAVAETDQLWRSALWLEPYRYSWYVLYGEYLMIKERYPEGLQVLEMAVERAPYRQESWDRLVEGQVHAVAAYLERGDRTEAERLAQAARETVARYEEHVEHHFGVGVPTTTTIVRNSSRIRESLQELESLL